MNLMNQLYMHLCNYSLTEFLKGLTDKELVSCINKLYNDDIIGDAALLLDALLTEVQYRQQDQLMANNNSGMLNR